MNRTVEEIFNGGISRYKKETQLDTDLISDGYHTFGELYEFRKTFNVLLFNQWSEEKKYDIHKSFRHSDGEWCFDGEYFIVVAELPTGQISFHYELKDWNLFKVPEKVIPNEFDGHTPQDVLERLKQL